MNIRQKGGAPGIFSLAIHGGAGAFAALKDEMEIAAYHQGLEMALRTGRDILASGGSALDAVEAAVLSMEDNPLFNCGKGSVFNSEGFHEMDASIMDGNTLACGAGAGLKTVRNPIRLARRVMEHSPHVFLAGAGAEEFARLQGLELVAPDYFSVEKRRAQWLEARRNDQIQVDHDSPAVPEKMGTVGAVARDCQGRLAAATSTGGVTNKKFGRVGDSPVIGAGNYADSRTCAVSCTGKGEEFIRIAAAFDVHARMCYQGVSLQQAAETVIHDCLKTGDGGLIAVGHDGTMALSFNTRGMLRGQTDHTGLFRTDIF
ncbi:MAG TPA: isoaspartyl peptidase/L-asparaginase [Patescibacteria group bacterium]|nr:isoaspartyl peptidase/L-asparaginase [Patescibacteria group bacterium]